MRCSYIEIYTDNCFDLLKPQSELGDSLTITEDMNV